MRISIHFYLPRFLNKCNFHNEIPIMYLYAMCVCVCVTLKSGAFDMEFVGNLFLKLGRVGRGVVPILRSR